MAPAEAPASLRVEVAFAAAPRRVDCVVLQLPAGSTVDDAVRASGLLPGEGPEAGAGLMLAVWGRRVESATLLRDRDRVELLRPLQVDPKEARRQRHRSQGRRR
jgi:hypothetical protein